ncbi:MAG TPA: hypothetical protein VF581_05525 [Flavobacterium sp.]|jgi:hypothetical protein
MAKIKKISSATLVEAIVATVLILVIFVIASLVLNNILRNHFASNTHPAETRMNNLEYQIYNSKVAIPYTESAGDWEISIRESESAVGKILILTAVNSITNKEISRTRIYEKE